MIKSITQNLFKRQRYMVPSEGSRIPMTETGNAIVLGLWSSYELRSFASRQLGSLLSFAVHSKTFWVTIAMQWAKSRPRVTRVDRSSVKSISWVTSNGCSGVIPCPIFKNKVCSFRQWRDLSNYSLFVEIRWEIITQGLSKLYQSPATDFWLARQ